MNGTGVWRVWVKTEEEFRRRWERPSERQKKQQEKSKGKNLATSRKDHEVKGERVVSEVCKETNVGIWEDGMAVTSQRAAGWGMGHSLKKHALNKEEAVQ